jgi:hypothetical protein
MRKYNKNLEPYGRFDGGNSLKYNGKHDTLTKVGTTGKLKALKSRLICALAFKQNGKYLECTGEVERILSETLKDVVSGNLFRFFVYSVFQGGVL